MAYFLNEREITKNEETNQYYDKEGNLLDLQTLLDMYDESMTQALEAEEKKTIVS